MDDITRAIVINIQRETLELISAMVDTGANISDAYKLDSVRRRIAECNERIASVTTESI